jgi:hypothetical protein
MADERIYRRDNITMPEGWVAYSSSPTPDAWVGYGAGFWTNQGDSFGANYRVGHGWPRDAFFAKGTIGQYVIVIPVGTTGGCTARCFAKLARCRRRVTACQRCHRGNGQQRQIGRRQLTAALCCKPFSQ